MEGVQKLVKNELKDVLKKQGFKTRKFNFYRQVNGIVQGFKIYANGHYTIRYNMFPLVWGVEYDNYIFESEEIAELTQPERDTFLQVIQWHEIVTDEDYERTWGNRYETYKVIAKQLVDETYKYLLPLFSEYDTPEKHFGKSKWKRLESFYDSVEWCLQARNFDLAHSYLEKALLEERDNSNPYFMNKLLTYKSYLDRNAWDELEKHIEEKEIITLRSFGFKK